MRNEREFTEAVDEAFRYDTKILIEASVTGREIECAVLGNEHPIASVPGEIEVRSDFYSYDSKYIDENGAALRIPANVTEEVAQRIRSTAVEVFNVLCCKGMARVDFFLTDDGQLLLNEINTIPGFTSSSMYPKLWEYSGIPYAKLVNTLLDLAIERFNQRQKLFSSFRAVQS